MLQPVKNERDRDVIKIDLKRENRRTNRPYIREYQAHSALPPNPKAGELVSAEEGVEVKHYDVYEIYRCDLYSGDQTKNEGLKGEKTYRARRDLTEVVNLHCYAFTKQDAAFIRSWIGLEQQSVDKLVVGERLEEKRCVLSRIKALKWWERLWFVFQPSKLERISKYAMG